MEDMYERIRDILINSNKPSIEIKTIVDSEEFKSSTLSIITELKKVEQNKVHHPEGNVWNHTMMVVDIAAKLRGLAKNKEEFMWGSLLHDIGKKDTTKIRKGRITSYNHDNRSYELINEILKNYNIPLDKIKEISNLAKYHMHHLYLIKDLPFKDIEGLLREVCVNDILLLFISDKLGRGAINSIEIEKAFKDVNEIIRKLDLDNKYFILMDNAKKILNSN